MKKLETNFFSAKRETIENFAKKAFPARFCALVKEHSPKFTITHEYTSNTTTAILPVLTLPNASITRRQNQPHVMATHKKHHYATDFSMLLLFYM